MFIILVLPVFAQQNNEDSRKDVIQYGTETEIANLIQSLRSERADYFDEELAALANNSKNMRILTGVFGFFGEREKTGLEERAIKAIEERDEEATETVLGALDYLGKLKSSDSVNIMMDLLETEERRYLNAAFRAIGKAASSDKKTADETAEFLVEFYNFREPGNDNRSAIIGAIGDTGSSAGVEMLSELALNTDERIPLRIAAISAISKIADSEGLNAVLSCVTTNDPNVRSAAIAALGPFSGEAVDKAILDGFRDSYYRTRIASAQASRDRKLAAAVPYLKFRAERDDVPNVKDEAIRSLGAIANEEAVAVLESLFTERKNTDRVRILAADMLSKNTEGKNFKKLIVELDEAKSRNQNNLYNGFLKVVGESVAESGKADVEDVARRFMKNGTLIEKLYALDMALNNKLNSLSDEIIALTKEKNESLSRKAKRTAESLGITIPDA
ncbi:MAG: HEAT repeat domain-containing protein [Treponema sp.]|nr:HEAT repeat domain-containing protein [Treponema sp.]